MSNNSTANLHKDFIDPDDKFILDAKPLADTLSIGEPEAIDILPGFIHEARNTIVLVAPGIDDQARMFAAIIAHRVSSGSPLPPLGITEPCVTFHVSGAGSRKLLLERLELLDQFCKSSLARRRAQFDLHLNRSNRRRSHRLFLNWLSGQRTFLRTLPKNCKLVIFADADWWLTTKEENKDDYSAFGWLLADLNKMGIATVSFVQNRNKGTGVFDSEFLIDGTTTIVELTKDAGAPREFGGGFNVTRRKISEHDPVPLHFQFWFRVIDRTLTFGWECRDPDDATTAKKVEISERQKRVKDLLAKGMQQKDIATEVEVDAATVSRDVAKIKADERRTRAADDKPGEKPVNNLDKQGERAADDKSDDEDW